MKIFLIGPIQSTFVKNDIQILSKKHKIITQDSAIGRGLNGAFNLILASIKSIYKTIISDIIFCWFADYTTLIPSILAKIFRKKIYVVAGGFDVTNLPEINCGARLRLIRWFCVKNTFKLANKIFTVSNFAKKNLINLIKIDESKVKLIYNCIDVQRFINGINFESNREFILTVAQSDSWVEYLRKGIPKFIQLAKIMRNEKFVIAGLRSEALELAKKDAKGIDNIQIIPGPLNLYDDLIPLYLKSYAYCQLSIEETFGVAVLEAMICGSVPIVSNGGALPEITNGSDAIIVTNVEDAINAINLAKNFDIYKRRNLQKFVSKYDINERAKVLLEQIKGK